MNKDNLKGKAKDITGRIERQAGEWTGDEESQARGLGRQAEGKVQDAWGNVKEGAREMGRDIRESVGGEHREPARGERRREDIESGGKKRREDKAA